MRKGFRKAAVWLLLVLVALTGCRQLNAAQTSSYIIDTDDGIILDIDEAGSYTQKDDVAAYIHLYGHLPENYITKNEARALGWVSKKGNLDDVAPGMSIGGDRYGNYEGLLPEEPGRDYFECDVNYNGGYRGKDRIIYSDDGLIYYTNDHYQSFEQLY